MGMKLAFDMMSQTTARRLLRALSTTEIIALSSPTASVDAPLPAPEPGPLPGGVRPLSPDDVDGVVALHRLSFGSDRPEAELGQFLSDVFFRHPWMDESLPSLGYFAEDGALIGCLGVMPRPMLLGSERIRAVVSHNFMVHPRYRRSLAALRLLKAMVARGPDLVLAEGNKAARTICESIGGRVVSSRCQRWLRVLRPTALLLHMGEGKRAPRALTRGLRSLARVPDACLAAIPGSPVRRPAVRDPDSPLDEPLWSRLIEAHTQGHSLRPVYEEHALSWLMGMLLVTRREQRLRAFVVQGARGPLGWYVYYSRPHGVGRVLQVGADADAREVVLEHLFADAEREGNVALSGQTDPAWSDALSASRCFFRPGRSWLLAHTASDAIRGVLDSPRAFLSRLEGEAWLQFAY